MRYALVSIILAVAACSSGGSGDLPAVKGMRSAAAEWALVNREAREQRLTRSYIVGARQAARENIATELQSLAGSQPRVAREAEALLALQPDAPPEAIMAHIHSLRQIETDLESS